MVWSATGVASVTVPVGLFVYCTTDTPIAPKEESPADTLKLLTGFSLNASASVWGAEKVEEANE